MKKTIKKLVSLTIASVMLLYAPLSALAEKSEADAAKAAEEEKVWESVEAFGEQFAETNAQTLSDMGIETCTNDEPTVSALSETEGTYSEVLDINTVDDLLAINNHRGGYYDLRQDLDLSGMEWTPIYLDDAVFEGHGHTISGMTINTVDEDIFCNLGGLFAGGDGDTSLEQDIYVRDVNLQNFKIDLDLTDFQWISGMISPFGGAQAEDCKISGSINVKMRNNINRLTICALRDAINTRADVDMNISFEEADPDDIHTYGMESCVDCTLYGDIDVDFPLTDHGIRDEFCAISSSANCKRYGDISFSGSRFYGISDSDNCKNYGKIDCARVDEAAYCIYNSENCAHEGDMEFDNMGYCSVIFGGTNCTAKGEVRVKSGSAEIITDNSVDCSYTGDVTAKGYIYGIRGSGLWGLVSKNCRIDGNLTSEKDEVEGIIDSESCVINGNLTALADAPTPYKEHTGFEYTPNAFGISNGVDCVINGNIRAGESAIGMRDYSESNRNCLIRGNITGKTAFGIERGTSCTIIGNITATNGLAKGFFGSSNTLKGTVSATYMGFHGVASSSARYVRIIECNGCLQRIKTVKDNYDSEDWWEDPTYAHCVDENGEPAGASEYRLLAYYGPAPGSGGEGGGGGGEYTPKPTTAPKSYIMQIIDTQTQDPVSGADVTIDNERYLSDTNGMVRLEKAPAVGMLKIELGGSVIYTDNEFSPVANTINKVYVKGLSMDADDLDLGNSDDAVMEGPSVNLFGRETPLFKLPLSVDVKFFKRCEIAYDKDENIYQVIIDMGEEDDDDEEEESSGGSKKIKDAKSASWTDKFNEAKLEYELAENVNLGVEFNPKEGVGSKLGIDGKISAATFLELRPEGDGLRLLDGGAYIKFEGQYKGGVHLPPPVSVVYLAFGVTGEFLADAKLTLKEDSTFANPKFGFAADINAELTPSLGVGLGAQEKLCVEAGVKGKFDMELGLPMTKLEEKLKINFTGQAYFLAMFVVGKVGLDWDFYEDQLYPNTGGGVGPMSIDDLGDFELIDRSYLDAPMPASLDDVKSVVYPYGSVQTAKLSDGRVVMVWLDDDQSRNVVNKTALYYSVLDSGEWSAPAQIENDGTADFGFDLKAYDDKAAIVWQDTGRTFEDNGDTAALINDMANASELSYSVFNGSAWSSSTAVTNGNSDYEYIPSLYYDGKTAYIAWAQNASGSALPQTDDALVYTAQVKEDGSVSSEQKYDDAMSVYSIAAGENGSTAIVIDKDKDPETEDYTLLINGIKGTDKTTEYDTENVISGLRFVDDKYYFTEDGAVRSIDAASDPRIILEGVSDGAAYITDGTNTAVIYELQDTQSEQYTSNLYASYYNDDDDEWTNPVQITDFDEKIRSWDAYFNDDGEISISAVLANINTEGAKIVDTARLVHVGADPIADMAVTSLAAAEDVTPGGKADFVITAVNNSITDISSVNVTLTGEKSGEIYNGEVDVNIPAGESEKITVRADIPDDFTSQEVTAAVSTSDIADLYAENDSVTAGIGYGNLSVELRDYNVISDGEAEVIVKNTGCDAVTGASLKVTDENGSEIYTDDLGTMAGGETRKITVPIAEHYYAFTDEYTSFAMTAAVTAESGDALKYDNEYSCRVYRRTAEGVRAAEDQIVLSAGETYQARFNVYPAEFADDTTIYYTSSDTSVAGVDENGMITAIANGTAKITAMIDGAETTAKMTVYVRDMGKPEITEAMYDYGFIEIDIDTSACLANGEKELLIVAAYAEDGSLMGVEMSEVTGPSEREYMSMWADSGKPKTIKAMIWSGTDGMKPMSLTDTAEVQERSYD